MEEKRIKTELYKKVLFETIKRGATEISADVKEAFGTKMTIKAYIMEVKL